MSSTFLASAIDALPTVAIHPMALVGYVIAIGAWIFAYNKTGSLKVIMRDIAKLPEKDRKDAITQAIGVPIPSSITAGEWIASQRQKYFLTAFIVTAAVALVIFGMILYIGVERAKAIEAARARVRVCQDQISAVERRWEDSRSALQATIEEIEGKISFWAQEQTIAMRGMQLTGNPDDIPILIARATDAEENRMKHVADRDKVKQDLNKLVASRPEHAKCD